MNKKVIVAMSGGIDSSVAAALLTKGGFKVIGIFMRFWSPLKNKSLNKCCSPESQERARIIAHKLNIPFYVLNFEKEFKKRVVDYFIKEYDQGRTPNPCVVCNKEIKFGMLMEKAMGLEANFIATGHYAQLKNNRLYKGKDKSKDQTYFLWQLSQKQLKHTMFPVGDYTKKQVIAMGKKLNLPIAGIPESQEVCFVQNKLKDFLSQYIKFVPGNIITSNKEIIGQHKGIHFYTIGQRKGIDLPGGPFYVLKKNKKQNTLIVTKNEKELYTNELSFKNTNWISKTSTPLTVDFKIRYRGVSTKGTITDNKIIFKKAQKAVAPGQSIVFYNKEELLGGGIIKS